MPKETIFIEHLVAQKPTLKLTLSRVGIVLLALTVDFIAGWIFPPIFAIVFAISCWAAWKWIKSLKVEFEYVLTDSTLDIDRIFGQSFRRRFLSVDIKKFDIMAPCRPEYAKEYSSAAIGKTVDCSSEPSAEDRYFAVYTDAVGTRTLLWFEPNGKMLDAMRIYLQRKLAT